MTSAIILAEGSRIRSFALEMRSGEARGAYPPLLPVTTHDRVVSTSAPPSIGFPPPPQAGWVGLRVSRRQVI